MVRRDQRRPCCFKVTWEVKDIGTQRNRYCLIFLKRPLVLCIFLSLGLGLGGNKSKNFLKLKGKWCCNQCIKLNTQIETLNFGIIVYGVVCVCVFNKNVLKTYIYFLYIVVLP